MSWSFVPCTISMGALCDVTRSAGEPSHASSHHVDTDTDSVIVRQYMMA
jgi:hypothetical protein